MIKIQTNWQRIRGLWWAEDTRHIKEEKPAAIKTKGLYDATALILIWFIYMWFFK